MTRSLTRGIGQVPDGLDRLAPGLDEFLQATRKILLDAQLGRLSASSLTSGATAGGVESSGDEVDPTTPPTPSGVSVVAGITFVGITTDPPVFTAGHGYGRTLVYGAKWTSGPLPTFSAAVKVHEFVGDVGAFPSEPATQWHIWVIWRSRDGYNSDPEGGLNGRQITTGQDVSLLLQALSGQITESELYAALGARIDLIDAASGVAGSVNQRIATSASDLTAAFTSGDSTTYASAQTYVQGYAYSQATIDSAFTSQFNALTANYQSADSTVYSNAQAYVGTYAYSKATVDGAFTSQFNTLTSNYQSADSTISASVTAEASTRATVDGYLGGLYTVRVQLTEGGRTIVGGFGLSGTSAPGAGPEIAFGVRADRFWIGAPSGTTGVGDVLPFVVQTSDEVVNGVTIPKGVYMDAAYIKNLTAMTARLGSLWVTNGMIVELDVAKLRTGSLTVGNYIQSSSYVPGSSGWRIHANGSAEFSFAMIRGTLQAAQVAAGFVTATMIGAGEVTATKINVTSLGAITATIGLLRTASTGSRMEIENNVIRIYDSGTLRVKIGNLA